MEIGVAPTGPTLDEVVDPHLVEFSDGGAARAIRRIWRDLAAILGREQNTGNVVA